MDAELLSRVKAALVDAGYPPETVEELPTESLERHGVTIALQRGFISHHELREQEGAAGAKLAAPPKAGTATADDFLFQSLANGVRSLAPHVGYELPHFPVTDRPLVVRIVVNAMANAELALAQAQAELASAYVFDPPESIMLLDRVKILPPGATDYGNTDTEINGAVGIVSEIRQTAQYIENVNGTSVAGQETFYTVDIEAPSGMNGKRVTGLLVFRLVNLSR